MDARITSVEERIIGSALVSDTSIGATTLTVSDGTDFDLSGNLQVGSETLAYTNIDEETGIITLTGTAAATHTADDPVYVYPLSQERIAYLVEGDDPKDEEGMAARIPHALWDKIPVGIRDWTIGEGETVQADLIGDELVILELVGQDPVVDGSFIDTTTLPPVVTDGLPPVSSPAPSSVLGGIGSLQIKWVAISNADPVTYEVHVSTSTGFTPSGTTLAGQTGGTLLVAHTLPATGAPLESNVVYYVKLIAKDDDGAAAAGTEGSGSPRTADVDDLAVGSVEADTILANAITADKLESVLAIISTILAGTADAARVEVGLNPDDSSDLGIRAYNSANSPTLRVDGQDGSVYIRGRLDFGTKSRLLQNDIVELGEQPTTGFQTPQLVQRNSAGKEGGGSDLTGTMGVIWPSPTTTGNLLLCVVSQINSGGASTPTTPTVGGWTQVQTATQGSGPVMRQTIFKIENAATRSGTEVVTFGGGSNTRNATAQIFCYSGVGVQDVLATSNSGTTSSATTTSSGTLGQAGEVVFASFTNQSNIFSWGGLSEIGNATANHIGGSPPGIVRDLVEDAGHFITTSTSSVTATATVQDTTGYIAQLVTFKAKALGVDAPDAGTVRIFMSDDGGGSPAAHVKDDAARENSLMMAPAGDGWRAEYTSVAVNWPSTGAHTAATDQTPSIGGLLVGDLCFIIGFTSGSAPIPKAFIAQSEGVCTTNGQITIHGFNADSVTVDPASTTYHFLVIHRS